MDRVTVKTSTIFVGRKGRTEVYRSLEDVPPRLRKKLIESTKGSNSGTILIADRSGRDAIVRAAQGLPTGVQTRTGALVAARRLRKISTGNVARARHIWPELALILGLGLTIWIFFILR